MRAEGVRIGRTEDGDVLRYKGGAHLLTVAPTRAGKGRDILIPALLEWPYSAVVIDPKAELACVTSKQRARYGDVKFLDPYGEVARYLGKSAASSRYNPLARLDPRSIEFAAQAAKISEGLNPDEGNGYRFFSGGARGLCSGIQMGLTRHAEPDEHTLIAMRSVLTGEFQGGIDVFSFAKSIMEQSSDTVLKQLLARYGTDKARESRSLADVIATADVNTHFLSDYAVARCFSGSDFSFTDLKKSVMTIYVVLPMDYLGDASGTGHSGFFSTIVASALSELLRGKRGLPVVLLMDEFALYPLNSIRMAFGNAAGFGVMLWPVLQDLNQVSHIQGWETFISNAAVRMYFGPRDERTSRYLSGQCGLTERRVISKSISYQNDAELQELAEDQGNTAGGNQRVSAPRAAGINVGFGSTTSPLLSEHQTRQLDSDEMLLFVEGVKNVIRAKRRPYWEEPEFRGRYSQNPYFGK
jgi:type IV secretion system protein VirD4